MSDRPGNRHYVEIELNADNTLGKLSAHSETLDGDVLPPPMIDSEIERIAFRPRPDDPMPALRPTTAGLDKLINDLELE
jgi:hypothetical protein